MAKNSKLNINKIINDIGISKLLIIAACGVVLVMLPDNSGNKKINDNIKNDSRQDYSSEVVSTEEYCRKMEEKLKVILENTEGVGKAKVMITLKSSSEKIVLMEEKESIKTENDNESSSTDKSYENTVVLDGSEYPYVIKENEPVVSGVYVVAEGGNNSEVVLKITNIIKSLFGLEAHKIFVAGME